MQINLKTTAFLGAVGLGAFLIWRKFFGAGATVQPVTPVELPGLPPSTLTPGLPGPAVEPGLTPPVITPDVVAEDVATEAQVEIPGIYEKSLGWDCSKKKEMLNTYRRLARKDKDATTIEKAQKAAELLETQISTQCVLAPGPTLPGQVVTVPQVDSGVVSGSTPPSTYSPMMPVGDSLQQIPAQAIMPEAVEIIPGIVEKSQSWDCQKLREMKATYSRLSKKDKDRRTLKKARTAVEWLGLAMQHRGC